MIYRLTILNDASITCKTAFLAIYFNMVGGPQIVIFRDSKQLLDQYNRSRCRKHILPSGKPFTEDAKYERYLSDPKNTLSKEKKLLFCFSIHYNWSKIIILFISLT